MYELKVQAGSPPNKEIRNLIMMAAIVATIILILYAGCLLLGRCYLRYDSQIRVISICLKNTTYQTVPSFSTDIEEIYLCGQIEGTTPRPGGLYLFFQDTVIYTTDFEQPPGVFFKSLPIERMRQPGTYRIEIWYAKRLLATTEFSVTLP
jgi:hypothetical protein